jgi:hypothetical protein
MMIFPRSQMEKMTRARTMRILKNRTRSIKNGKRMMPAHSRKPRTKRKSRPIRKAFMAPPFEVTFQPLLFIRNVSLSRGDLEEVSGGWCGVSGDGKTVCRHDDGVQMTCPEACVWSPATLG